MGLNGDLQFKDEYKRRNAEFEYENAQLRSENAGLFSAAINERDSRIVELEDSENSLKQQMSSLDAQHRSDNYFTVVFQLILIMIAV